MTDNPLASIGGRIPTPWPAARGTLADRLARADDARSAGVQPGRAPRRGPEPEPASRESPRQEASPRPAPTTLRNIRLQFKIDTRTGDVTVLLVDVDTRQIIRTIPPEELRKLARGQLVELLT